MSQLTLWASGFLVYPIRGRTPNGKNGVCRTIVAPKVPLFRHECLLFIGGEITDGGGLPFKKVEGGVVLPLTNCHVAFSDSSEGPGAQASNLDLIPDFEALACGAKLASEWRDESKLDVTFDLLEGTLSAEPDRYTNMYEWSWSDCDGNSQSPRRLTSLTRYKPTLSDGVVRISASEADLSGAWTRKITLGSGALTLAFLNAPTDNVTRAQGPDLDFAHFKSTLQLCQDPEPPPQLTKTTPNDEFPGTLPEPELPVGVEAFLYDRDNTLRGRPHCGGRLITEEE
jgi:hypothetical protein